MIAPMTGRLGMLEAPRAELMVEAVIVEDEANSTVTEVVPRCLHGQSAETGRTIQAVTWPHAESKAQPATNSVITRSGEARVYANINPISTVEFQ